MMTMVDVIVLASYYVVVVILSCACMSYESKNCAGKGRESSV